jgi:hydroxymethylpyrimidine/phosphomethylpyrimidine kinase
VTSCALTIAGTDPSGGAGIQQDLAVFRAIGTWGVSVVTAVTAQNTATVLRWEAMPPALVRSQLEALAADVSIGAAKTGMLATEAIVVEVARAITDLRIPNIVIDPVLSATSGDRLSDDGLARALIAELIPMAALVTPNAQEASILTGIDVSSSKDQTRAAQALIAMGARAALVKGGHLGGEASTDVLVVAGGDPVMLSAPRAPGAEIHGTGCVLSAAITAGLAQGRLLPDAVRDAKAFLTQALQRTLKVGMGSLVIEARA